MSATNGADFYYSPPNTDDPYSRYGVRGAGRPVDPRDDRYPAPGSRDERYPDAGSRDDRYPAGGGGSRDDPYVGAGRTPVYDPYNKGGIDRRDNSDGGDRYGRPKSDARMDAYNVTRNNYDPYDKGSKSTVDDPPYGQARSKGIADSNG